MMDAERHNKSEVFAFLQQVSSQHGNQLVLSLKAGLTYSFDLRPSTALCLGSLSFVACG